MTEPAGRENLLREGIPEQRIHFVGIVMIDTLPAHQARARAPDVPVKHRLNGDYGVLTSR